MSESGFLKDPTATATALGVVIGALIAVATFLATYAFVERPKLQLEERKLALEAYKQAVLFQPKVDFDCSPIALSDLTIEVICEAKNEGEFAASYELDSVEILPFDREKLAVKPNVNWYSVEKSETRSFVTPDGSSSLKFLIHLGKDVPAGTNSQRFMAHITFVSSTDRELTDLVVKHFPDTSSLVENSRSVRTRLRIIALPAPGRG